jgi:hypothetical protein
MNCGIFPIERLRQLLCLIQTRAGRDRPPILAVFSGHQVVDKLLADIATDLDLFGGAIIGDQADRHLSPAKAAHLMVRHYGAADAGFPQ